MSQEETNRTDGGLFTGSGPDGAISRIFMNGAGVSPEMARRRPVIGIAASASDLVPCNLNHGALVAAAKRGIIAAGGWPLEFPTIALGEPFVRPTTMLLRNLMSMDVEEMISSSPIDGVLLIGGCDKTVPAQLMGAVSAGRPAMQVVSGPRGEGFCAGRRRSVDDLWPLLDERRAGALSDEQWLDIERGLNPGVGTCNVLGTATTMAALSEVLGFALPGSSLASATSGRRIALAEQTGEAVVAATRAGVTPDQLVTDESIENAFRVLAALGGSTNAIIHLQSIAGRAGLRLPRERIDVWLRSTPTVARVKPAGEASLEQLDEAGGVPAVFGALGDLVHGEARSARGRWRDVVADLPPSGDLIERGTEAAGSLVMLSGSLAPGGAVLKRSAADNRLWQHTGPAVVFSGVVDLHARIDDPALGITADSVLVLTSSGPIGGPGMPEVGQLPIPRRLLNEGVRDMVRISDARMSGTASGCCILHVVPESAAGGPLGLVRDGDLIRLDAEAGLLDLLVDADELDRRRAEQGPAARGPRRGYPALYHRHVLQADEGCDFDFLVAASDEEAHA